MHYSRNTKEELEAELKRIRLLIAEIDFEINVYVFGGIPKKSITDLENEAFILNIEVKQIEKILSRR